MHVGTEMNEDDLFRCHKVSMYDTRCVSDLITCSYQGCVHSLQDQMRAWAVGEFTTAQSCFQRRSGFLFCCHLELFVNVPYFLHVESFILHLALLCRGSHMIDCPNNALDFQMNSLFSPLFTAICQKTWFYLPRLTDDFFPPYVWKGTDWKRGSSRDWNKCLAGCAVTNLKPPCPLWCHWPRTRFL